MIIWYDIVSKGEKCIYSIFLEMWNVSRVFRLKRMYLDTFSKTLKPIRKKIKKLHFQKSDVNFEKLFELVPLAWMLRVRKIFIFFLSYWNNITVKVHFDKIKKCIWFRTLNKWNDKSKTRFLENPRRENKPQRIQIWFQI